MMSDIERRKRSNPLERAIFLFLGIFLLFIILGVFVLMYVVFFTDVNMAAPSSESVRPSWDDSVGIRLRLPLRGIRRRSERACRRILRSKLRCLFSVVTERRSTEIASSPWIPLPTCTRRQYDWLVSSKQISFWVRMKDLVTPGIRTVVSTHDNLCSKQDERTVNGYALFFEVLESKQMYDRASPSTLVVSTWCTAASRTTARTWRLRFSNRRRFPSLTRRLNRWTQVSVVFNSLTEKPQTSLYRCDIAVYINGVFQDSVTTTRHLTVRSPSLFHADLAPPPHRQRRLRRRRLPRRHRLRGRSAARRLPHRSSAARWSRARCSGLGTHSRSRTRCWSRCCSWRSCGVRARSCWRAERRRRCRRRRWTHGRGSCSGRRRRWRRMVCLTQSRKRGRETESPEELLAQKEREARLAAQRARHAPKQETETAAAAAAEEKQEDLQGNTVVFFDTSGGWRAGAT